MRGGEVRSGHRAGGDEHPLAEAAAEDVEGDQTGAATLDLYFEEGTAGEPLDSLGRPHVADHCRLEHQRSFSISTPRTRALSRASGVSTALGPRTRRAASAAAFATARSV